MNVKRLPKDPGPAAWNEILPKQPSHPSLEDNITTDWLIIGAGFAGLAAARRLAQLHAGDRISLLEARCIAEGPAGRNSGFMIDLPHRLTSDDYGGDLEDDRRHTRLNRAGINFALAAADEYSLSEEAITASGKINAAASDKGNSHNAAYARHLQRLQEPCEMLDAQQMRDITGIDYYQGGLFTPGTVMIQPAMFIRGVAAGILSNRVTLYEHSPVLELNRSANQWLARTPSGSITAPKVILAVNGHAQSFGLFKRRLMHIFTYASMTRALSAAEVKALGGQPVWGLTPADPLGTTVRRISGTGGDRLIIRNRASYDPSMEVSEQRIADVARVHEQSFKARFPMLANVTMDYRWGGRLCLSRNNVSAFGQAEEGLYTACCQNGLGTAKGTTSGMLAAELASNLHSSLLEDLLSEAEPSRLPPEPLAYLGANATIRWGEMKAGREL